MTPSSETLNRVMVAEELNHAVFRAAIAIVGLVVTSACGGSPTAPAAGSPPLLTGAYLLAILGPDVTTLNGQLVQACPGAAAFGYIQANAIVEEDGPASRVRPSTPADGDFELRLLRGSVQPQLRVSVSGSIRGLVINTMYSFQFGGAPVDARAWFSGLSPTTDAQVDGVTFGASVLTGGLVSGNVALGNVSGPSINCASGTVSWSLSRLLR